MPVQGMDYGNQLKIYVSTISLFWWGNYATLGYFLVFSDGATMPAKIYIQLLGVGNYAS